MEKIVFISGATAGIGMACAEKFAENGYNIVANGRRGSKLQSLKKDLEERFSIKVYTLIADVRNKNLLKEEWEKLPENWKAIDILINNAGLALGLSTIQDGDTEDWEQMIDTNIKGLLYVSKMIMPEMIKRGKGHIINVGSIAGREVYPKGNVYCASKYAVDALSKSMRIDLLPYGIKVSQLAPGAAETEFSEVRFKGDKETAKAVYNGFEPLHPEDLAHIAFFMTTLPQHVNINDALVMPTAQACAGIFHKKNN